VAAHAAPCGYRREQRKGLIVKAVLDYLVDIEGKAQDDITTDDVFECVRRFGFTWNETLAAQRYVAAMEAEARGSGF
jgi:hypothetical protein